MRLLSGICAVAALECIAFADLSVQGTPGVQDIFGGKSGEVFLEISNSSAERTISTLSYRLFQLSSATAAPAGEVTEWKQMEVLAGQTIRERLSLELPSVKAATGFRVQVLDPERKVLGTVLLRALPEKPLSGVRALLGGSAVALVSTREDLAGALRDLGWEVEVISPEGAESFPGPLVILDGYDRSGKDLERLRQVAAIRSKTASGSLLLTKAPADELDRLKSARSERSTTTELALQPHHAPGGTAAFVWRLIEAAQATLEARK